MRTLLIRHRATHANRVETSPDTAGKSAWATVGPTTNNDGGAWKVFRTQAATDKSLNIELWREAGPRWDVKEVRVEKVDGSTAKVTVRADLPVVSATYAMTYTIHGDGEIQVECGISRARRSSP